MSVYLENLLFLLFCETSFSEEKKSDFLAILSSFTNTSVVVEKNVNFADRAR